MQKPPISLKLSAGLLLGAALLLSIGACSTRSSSPAASADGVSADQYAASRAISLAAAIPMPDSASYETHYLSWEDNARARPVAAKLYLPPAPGGETAQTAPLIVFSHGLGGSREGYTYMGKFWASKGYASLHLQHVGSDRSIWGGNPLGLVGRLQNAAKESEAIDRAVDLRFALDQLLASAYAPRINAQRIVAAGHSYGANTTLLVAGARVNRLVDGKAQVLNFRDPRIKGAVIISAPPFYGESDMRSILSPVQIPSLHITSTADEITIPGYHSMPADRVAVYEATGSSHKTLAVFKDGSHSMFTDRLNTGGAEWNPKVKVATRELAMAFFERVFDQRKQALTDWEKTYQPLMARFDQGQ